MNYSMTSAGEERWMPMYEFKIRLKTFGSTGIAKWTGATREDSNGIFRPLFEVKLDNYYGDPFLLTQEDFEFLEPPMII